MIVLRRLGTLLRGAPRLAPSPAGGGPGGGDAAAAAAAAASAAVFTAKFRAPIARYVRAHPIYLMWREFDWFRLFRNRYIRPRIPDRKPRDTAKINRIRVDAAADDFREFRYVNGEYVEWTRIPYWYLPHSYATKDEDMDTNAALAGAVSMVSLLLFTSVFWLVRDPLLALYYSLDTRRVKFERTAEVEMIREEEQRLDEAVGEASRPLPDFSVAPPVAEAWRQQGALRREVERRAEEALLKSAAAGGAAAPRAPPPRPPKPGAFGEGAVVATAPAAPPAKV